MSDDRPINVHEMRAMVVYVRLALEAGSDAERETALGEGIVAWGELFMVVLGHAARENPSWGEPLRDRALDLLSAWMGGRRLTRRADEDERRALAAIDMARRNPALARLAVEALGQLPEQHPTRRALLAEAVALMDDQASTTVPDQRLSILATKLDRARSSEQKDRLLQEGQALLPRSTDATAQRMFRLSAAGVLIELCIGARDRGDAVAQADLAAQARDVLVPILDEDATDGYPLVMEGLLLELEEKAASAVQAYLRALDDDLSDDRRLIALAGVLRTGDLSDRDDVVLLHAREALTGLVEQYATEPDPERAAANREDVDSALRSVATSAARAKDLALLLWALEVTSSARLRYRMTARRGRSGGRIRRLEAQLWAAERGLADVTVSRTAREGRLAQSVSALSQLREAHRRAASQLSTRLAVPDLVEVCALLGPEEGIVVLGTGDWGTAVLLLRRPATTPVAPSGQDVPSTDRPPPGGVVTGPALATWAEVLGAEEPPRWAYVLGAPWEYPDMPQADPRAALGHALQAANEHVGRRLAAWAERERLLRIWVVAHGVLGLVPWWGVAALRELDIRQAPCLALLPRARGASRLGGPVVLLGNATGDLPAAEAEVAAIADQLRRHGVTADVLPTQQSTEDAVTSTVASSTVLHFSGHATSELTDSVRSALHVLPEPRWSGARAVAELEGLANSADWSAPADGVRTAEVRIADPGDGHRPGLLREERLQNGIVLRYLEHGPSGTLLAAYLDGRLVRLAELWSAGDMAVSGALRGCRLAVLSACQSGGGELGLGSDELGGLPAALMLAGVRTVVCTAWTVDDVLSAITADVFWELLCARPAGVVDVYDVVRQTRLGLAAMSAAQAGDRIRRLRSFATSGRARFLLEGAAARLGTARPYAHPYDSAPLFVVGEPLVRWRTR
jgi:hypothetical protein